MMDWLEDAGVWGDVVGRHFGEHEGEILETVAKWGKSGRFSGTGRGGRTLGGKYGGPSGAPSFGEKLSSALSLLK